jgi:hypothetical protein
MRARRDLNLTGKRAHLPNYILYYELKNHKAILFTVNIRK